MKIGTVPYYNCLPLVGTLKEAPLVFAPSQLASALLNGDIDVGLIPAYSIIKHGLYAYPECGLIGCDGLVKSVGFFTKNSCELSDISSLYLDHESATSVRLGEIILREHFGRNLRSINKVSLEDCHNADAQLLIGDKALFFSEHGYTYSDLGKLWKNMTGNGFMFACWASKRALTSAEKVSLTAAKIQGLADRAELVKKLPKKNQKIILNYLTQNIAYDFTPSIEAGFKKFEDHIVRAVQDPVPDIDFEELCLSAS